ncbi:hypothetical protein EPH_0025640 [Eimeria praecox]|uniref:Serine aminopeptidase S33 domain-containing protein n=1 Tax=Eimeria praecox TaxID=51316 RepID=U6H9M4_9EIME|nr:hypothetical protein EPH_0025640 [Eimeria praecox]
MLHELGANVLLVDYRGFGRSEGSPTEEGVYKDADAILDFVLNSQTINNKDIIVLGHSLGGAVAIDLANRRGEEITGLVVENTFSSLREMAYKFHPEMRRFSWFLDLLQRRYMSNIDKVRTLKVPTLFLCGRKDQSIPPEHTDRLFEVRAGSPYPELREATSCRPQTYLTPLVLSVAPLWTGYAGGIL